MELPMAVVFRSSRESRNADCVILLFKINKENTAFYQGKAFQILAGAYMYYVYKKRFIIYLF